MSDIQYTNRYEALGIPYPNPETMCKGQCEGVGLYPVNGRDIYSNTAEEINEWLKLHHAHCSFKGTLVSILSHWEWWYWRSVFKDIRRNPREWGCDGWHFIKCPDCKGTGKRVIA